MQDTQIKRIEKLEKENQFLKENNNLLKRNIELLAKQEELMKSIQALKDLAGPANWPAYPYYPVGPVYYEHFEDVIPWNRYKKNTGDYVPPLLETICIS